ncbi:MAG: PAS domain-containing protein [Bryobacteraceae bacterium]
MLALQYWQSRTSSRERALAAQFTEWQTNLNAEADALPLDFRQTEPARAVDRVWQICRKTDSMADKLAASALAMPHAAREFRQVRDRLDGACSLKSRLMEQDTPQQRKEVESEFLLKLTQAAASLDRAKEALRTDPATAADAARSAHTRDLLLLGLAAALTGLLLLFSAGLPDPVAAKTERPMGYDVKAAIATDTSFRILSVSSAAEDLLRRSSADLVGKPLSVVFPGIGDKKTGRWRSVGRSQTVRETARNGEGASFPVDLEIHPNGDAFGTWIVFLTPIAPGTRPAHESDAFRLAAAPTIILDPEAHVVAMNLAAEEMTEFATAELRSCSFWDMFVDEADRSRAIDDFRRVASETAPVSSEQTWISRTGTRQKLRLSLSPVRDSSGHLRHAIVCCLSRAGGPPEQWETHAGDLQNHLTVMRGYLDLVLPTVQSSTVLYDDLAEAKRAADGAWSAASAMFGTTPSAADPPSGDSKTAPAYQSR